MYIVHEVYHKMLAWCAACYIVAIVVLFTCIVQFTQIICTKIAGDFL